MGRKKLTTLKVRAKIEPYGYSIANGEKYTGYHNPLKVYDYQRGKHRTISLANIIAEIRRTKRAEFDFMNILPVELNPETVGKEKFNFMDILPVELNQPPVIRNNSSNTRWLNRVRKFKPFQNLTDSELLRLKQIYDELIKKFARRRTFNINWSRYNIPSKQLLYVLIAVLLDVRKDPKKLIRMKITDKDGKEIWYTLTIDTLEHFTDLLNEESIQDSGDSSSDVFESYDEWRRIEVFFDDLQNKQGGFFPYLNKTSLDLSAYGIFNKIVDTNYTTNCFIQAIENSNVLTKTEIDLIKTNMLTRLIKVEDLQEIADLFDLEITIRFGKDDSDKTSFKKFTPMNTDNLRKLTLILYKDHFMIPKSLMVSEYYVAHYKELDQKYPNDSNRFNIINDEGKIVRKPMTIIRLIKLLKKYDGLEFIPIKEQQRIARLYKHLKTIDSPEILDECFKPIIIKDLNDKSMEFLNKLNKNDGSKLFGTKIPPKDLPVYYNKLQKIVNDLGSKARVRNYVSYSQLMEKVMFDFGCFNNVYKTTGYVADAIRNGLEFPTPHTADNKPFYSNKRLYYIDLNGAYLSVIDNIPAGKCNKDLEFGEKNTRIKELIDKMYEIRIGLKHSNPILANTIKLMMNCSWGMSIRKPKHSKKTRPSDKAKFIRENQPYVIEYSVDFIKYIKSISFNYTYPQFAREVLRNFNSKIKEVESIVKRVYYYNVDALLIDEDDFNKLNKLGYIGDNLGQFKIEHIFDEIAIKSQRVYMAKLDDGTVFNHTGNPNMDYDEFKTGVSGSPLTTFI